MTTTTHPDSAAMLRAVADLIEARPDHPLSPAPDNSFYVPRTKLPGTHGRHRPRRCRALGGPSPPPAASTNGLTLHSDTPRDQPWDPWQSQSPSSTPDRRPNALPNPGRAQYGYLLQPAAPWPPCRRRSSRRGVVK